RRDRDECRVGMEVHREPGGDAPEDRVGARSIQAAVHEHPPSGLNVKLAALPLTSSTTAASPLPLRHVSPSRLSPLWSRLWLKVMFSSEIVIATSTPSGTQRSREPAFID